jgi:UDP:flavonoid glycosyltransferase YjiC (YdhE family)
MSGLLAGVPQLIFPGRVFERCFNADSIVKIGAGIRCQDSDFTASKLDILIKKIVKDEQYYHAAQNYGKELRGLGGSHKTLSVIEEYVLHKK